MSVPIILHHRLSSSILLYLTFINVNTMYHCYKKDNFLSNISLLLTFKTVTHTTNLSWPIIETMIKSLNQICIAVHSVHQSLNKSLTLQSISNLFILRMNSSVINVLLCLEEGINWKNSNIEKKTIKTCDECEFTT